MKINTPKAGALMFDGALVSNGHWAISAKAARSSGLTFAEPYQFLIEKKIQFRKPPNERPMLEATLPNLGEVMSVGKRAATLTNIQVGDSRVVEWRLGTTKGAAQYRPEYAAILEFIELETGGDFFMTETETLTLVTSDGEVIGVLMPQKGDKETIQRSMSNVVESLQMEMEQIREQPEEE